MIIKSIELVDLIYSIKELEPSEDGTIYIGLHAGISNRGKKIDNDIFYIEVTFELDMDKTKPSEADTKKNGLYLTYGVYVDSLEKEDDFNDKEQEMILMQVEPYFSQKVNTLFAESKMKVPSIPINFWKKSVED